MAKAPKRRPRGAAATAFPAAEQMSPDSLYLDDKNPRMAGAAEGQSQEEIIEFLWREMAVAEIALSIRQNGFFQHEPLFATREGGRLVVIEGNRRLAAVKLLCDAKLRERVKATDLPAISEQLRGQLKFLPVIVCKRENIWQYVGFKHINGPQAWESYSKAKYISWVHNDLHQSLESIARCIGDTHSTVARLYNAWQVLEQAEKDNVWHRDNRARKHFAFSHLYTGLAYPGIQKFLGLEKKSASEQRPVSKAKLKHLGQLCGWLYGNKEESREPLIHSQNPDLRELDETLQSANGIAALQKGLPLATSLNISRGDERLFRESLVTAKQALEDARAKILTGYKGEADLLTMGEAIFLLASNVVEELRSHAGRRRKSSN
jgi:hypothetical protein